MFVRDKPFHFQPLIGTGSNGCLAGLLVEFTVNATPTVAVSSATAVCVNNTISLTAGGAASYVWSGDGSGSTNPLVYSSATSGVKVFSVTGTSVEGCVSATVFSLTVSPCTGIESQPAVQNIGVYPNPFSAELIVNGFKGRVELYNAIGQLVLSQPVNVQESINTAELAKGAYMVKLIDTNGNAVKTIKMMKN